MNGLSIVGGLVEALALGLVLWGLWGLLRAIARRRAYLRLPAPGEGGQWSGVVEAKDVYVPGTILRQLGVVLGGVLVAALGAPLLWAGIALADFVVAREPVRLATLQAPAPGMLRIEPLAGAAVEGNLPGGIRVAHAEFITFRGWLAKLGLGTHVRLTHVSSYANPAAVLQRKGQGRLDVAGPSALYRWIERLSRRFPGPLEAVRRFSGPLDDGGSAELWASSTDLAWRR